MEKRCWVFMCLSCAAMGSPVALGQQSLSDTTPMTQSPVAIDPIEAAIGSGDAAKVAHALEEIQSRIDDGQVAFDLWRLWLPAMINTKHYQEAADFSLSAALKRPGIEAIEPLTEIRAKAFLAMGKNDEALAAAKSYYNVCQMKNMGNALTLVASCLSAAHPGDDAANFRYEQALASAAAYATARPTARVSILKSVKIDPAPFAGTIQLVSKRADFGEQVGYGNLLLVAGRAGEAESVYRNLFTSADSPERLTQAIDGIARSLRAEDGDVARADAWLLALQQGGTASVALPNH